MRAGEQYDLYAYIRGELDPDTTQGRFLIRAKFTDINGASLGYSDITAMYPGAISSWTRVGGRVTAPANSVSMQVQYQLYMSSGWVNIDDVEITIVPPNAATEVTKYYYFGSQRVAMRKNGVLTYLHGDHLGSTVLETNITGTVTTDEKYLAYGKQRDSGKVTTDHRFTGQKEDASGLQYFNARFYDPVIGMFVSPDTMVPDAGNVFAYDRYMYVYGRVMNMLDPTGHYAATEVAQHFGLEKFDYDKILNMLNGNKAWLDILLAAQDGYQVSAWNSVLQSSAGGTFQRNANTGAIEIMSMGVAIPSAAIAAYAQRKPGDTSPLPAGYGLHNFGPYKLSDPFGADPFSSVYHGRNPGLCSIWDCTAIALDSASLGSSIAQTAAAACTATVVGAPACAAPTGYFTALDYTIGGAGVVYEGSKYIKGKSTELDLAVTGADDLVKPALRAFGLIPSSTPVVGIFWDS